MKRQSNGLLVSFWMNLAPVPASRPRVNTFTKAVYYGKPYTKFLKSAKSIVEAQKWMPSDKPLVVMIESIVEKPKTGKLTYPNGDTDNFAKGPLDALNKHAWLDDKQIVGLSTWKRYALPGEEPGVRIDWYELTEE